MNNFNKGDKVRCIEGSHGITLGKTYTVLHSTGVVVEVVRDDYKKCRYLSEKFELVTDTIDPTKFEKPFGLLTTEEQEALKTWEHGWEFYRGLGWVDKNTSDFALNFTYRAKRKPEVKEMTLSEISKALGYEVKIVK